MLNIPCKSYRHLVFSRLICIFLRCISDLVAIFQLEYIVDCDDLVNLFSHSKLYGNCLNLYLNILKLLYVIV